MPTNATVLFHRLPRGVYGIAWGRECYTLTNWLREPGYQWLIPIVLYHMQVEELLVTAVGGPVTEIHVGPVVSDDESIYWQKAMMCRPGRVENEVYQVGDDNSSGKIIEFSPTLI